MELSLILVLIIILAAEFTNGLTDAPNAIATVVSTRVMTPIQAVIMASVMNIIGAIVTGTAVAATIGQDIIKPEAIGLHTVAAALLTVIIWTMVAWKFGIPTSETHELLAGLAGAGLAAAGPSVLIWDGWIKVLLGLVISTVVGFGFGYLVMNIINRIFYRQRPSTVKKIFGRLQIVSAAFMAFSHGSNDGQKFMGVFALTLVLGGVFPTFHVPIWIILICGVTMGLGTILGGWRIIRTMGFKLTRLEPVQGFAAETSASLAIVLSSLAGVPLSTTHTINTAIMGVGSTKRLSAVRWSVTRQIVFTWVLTFPACGILGYLLALLIKLFI
jgi:PiT family inorganic phosphate transporter